MDHPKHREGLVRTEKFELPNEVSEGTVRTFVRLYQFETWLRELVYVELKANFGNEWWDVAEGLLRQTGGGGIPASKSLARDKKHPHMATPETDPIWFLSFDSLLKIVFHKRVWRYFCPFLTTKALLRAKFAEIAPIRNRVAHCRALHKTDLDRVETLMRDLDEGFWRFCTQYNHTLWVNGNPDAHPVATLFADWTRSYQPARTSVLVDLKYGLMSNGARLERRRPRRRGVVYHAVIYQTPDSRRYFDYPRILQWTRGQHQHVIHMILDSFQSMLRVTLPGMLEPQLIMEMIEQFHSACANSYTIIPIAPRQASASKSDPMEDFKRTMRPFEMIAAEWPHYVVPPSNPLAFLDPDCPCSFFSVV
jgi:hypothetical protein